MDFNSLYEGVELNKSTLDDKARTTAAIVSGAPNGAAVTSSVILTVWAKAVEADEDFTPVPSAQTLNGYLKRAVELNLIVKPTRQTYTSAPVNEKPSELGVGDLTDLSSAEGDLAEELGLAG